MKGVSMIHKYEELKKQKEAGVKLSFKEISAEQLRSLYVEEEISAYMISLLYDVKQTQVDNKRKRFGIKFKEIVTKRILENIPDYINEASKKRIIEDFDIQKIANMITHFAFRNGPVEDMHANNQLSQNDMKTLNKYMMNRLAGLLTLLKSNQWFKIDAILYEYSKFGIDWDEVEPDTDNIDEILKIQLRSYN